MLPSLRSLVVFVTMLLVLTALGMLAIFFVIWAGAIIMNDVHQHVSPWTDRGEIFLRLAPGVISLLIFQKAALYELRISSRLTANASRYQMPLGKLSFFDFEAQKPDSRKTPFQLAQEGRSLSSLGIGGSDSQPINN